MRILAVDDEEIALAELTDAIKEASPESQVFSFTKGKKAAEFAEKNRCDAAFLDIRLRGMSGLELALALKMKTPDINIIFATGYDEFLLPAIQQHCSGYLLKPIQPEQVKTELMNLRNPVQKPRDRVFAQTFGNFELFVEDRAVAFRMARSKEALAFLIDRRGAAITNAELAARIWEDNDNVLSVRTQVRKVRADLAATLKKAGAGDILRMTRNDMSVDTAKMSCDYWQMLAGDREALNSFMGEYMYSYSWAEQTLAAITEKIYK